MNLQKDQKTEHKLPAAALKKLRTQVTPHFEKLYLALNQDGATTRLVGGVVRDLLADKKIGDIDLATTLPPQQTMAVLEKAGFKPIPTGIKHGTITAVKDGEHYEITTLRLDKETDGRHAKVAFTTDFREDALRRDFTMNALYMTLDGCITDYFGGVADLKAGQVKFVGDACARIAEDYLRILRFFRFWSRFGEGAPDGGTLKAIKDSSTGLKDLSAERITAELLKLMDTPKPVEALVHMDSSAVLDRLDLSRLEPQGLAACLKLWPEAEAIQRLQAAAWLQSDRRPLYTNPHLIFSNKQKAYLKQTSRLHWPQVRLLDMPATVAVLGLERTQALMVYAAPWRWPFEKDMWDEAYDKLGQVNVPAFELKGQDMKALGFTGKAIGIHLMRTKEAWINAGFPDKAKTLTIARELANKPYAPILVVPDMHGDLAALKALQTQEVWQEAGVIVFLGDYIDGDEGGNFLPIVSEIHRLSQQDRRVIILRANHEQVNDHQFKQALRAKASRPSEVIERNRHNIALYDELDSLPAADVSDFMHKLRTLYRERSADGAWLTLGTGEKLVFAHGGWHPELIKSANIGASVLAQGAQLQLVALPKVVKNAVFWGPFLAAPDDQLEDRHKPLVSPPKGVELVVGHHFSRRKNLSPQHQANITFLDSGGGKGGRLCVMAICPQKGTRQYYGYDCQADSYQKIDGERADKLQTHRRNMPKAYHL